MLVTDDTFHPDISRLKEDASNMDHMEVTDDTFHDEISSLKSMPKKR